MTKGIAEKVVVLSRSKRSGKVQAAVTTNGYTKTRHGFATSVDGKPAIAQVSINLVLVGSKAAA